MHSVTSLTSVLTASFLASFVEVVEAFTIVLAVGITQGWPPAFAGTGLAFATLAAMVVVFGPLLSLIPIEVLQFFIGALLILFGMRWLRKAILRAGGHMAKHDEAAAFSEETETLERQRDNRRANYLAGLAAYKAVLLEGVEVVFIVIAIGAGHKMIAEASAGAFAAFLVVLIIGLAVHKPLSRVPENTLKFVVGLMLTSFGIFWTGEGLNVNWPGADLSILGIFVIFLAASLGLVRYVQGRTTSLEEPAR
jgi:uncharacterized membrane protein